MANRQKFFPVILENIFFSEEIATKLVQKENSEILHTLTAQVQ